MERADVGRRKFLNVSLGAAAAIATGVRPVSARMQGQTSPSSRVRVALIGTGNRGREVARLFLKNLSDIRYVAASDVYKTRLDQGMKLLTDEQPGQTVDVYEDYRRILERSDVDAVHISTPDHWHVQQMIDALAAGKDVYIEKPLSNTVERAVEGLRAYRASNRIVQHGTQQRSGRHFQEAARIVHEGQLGKVAHAVIQFPGNGYGSAPETVAPVPDGLNWDLYQGPAPRHPFKQSRLRWRGWWDYGGGLITDWGVHLTDVALWYMKAQHEGPLVTTGTSQYVNFSNPDRDQSPDAFSVSWQYQNFVMTFTNVGVQDWEFSRQGNFFFGTNGSLLIHRGGYEVRPPGGGFGRGGGRGAAPAGSAQPPAASANVPTPVQSRRVPWVESDGSDSSSMTIQHGRNFVDCVKSRQKPISDLEIGFFASLPCLLAVKAIREGKSFRWDDKTLKATAV